jgi:protein ImuA
MQGIFVEPVIPAAPVGAASTARESDAWRIKQRYFAHRLDIGVAGILSPAHSVLSSGFETLDAHLPGGGWPLGALTEILVGPADPGCLWLAVPALIELSQRQQWIAMISPPRIPYAPALTRLGMDVGKVLLIHPRQRGDALWAVEEALKSSTCSSVLFWLSGPDNKILRRLQLAAEQGGTLGFCFRPTANAGQRTTAAVRLKVTANDNGATLDLVKVRGGRAHRTLQVRFADIGYC